LQPIAGDLSQLQRAGNRGGAELAEVRLVCCTGVTVEKPMKHYVHLLIMAALSFMAMYILMYAMVDRFENVYPNLNQTYMAALMTAPMVMIELVVMRSMYKHRTANIAIFAASILVLAASWFAIRQQTLIGDNQFLKSMIPHHAGAILMCDQAALQDGEITKLCKEIISGQQKEIDQMKAVLRRLASR
jgi:hypothetical protein